MTPRYRPENLLLCGLTPGPKELTAEEMQRFLKDFVTDLLNLYDNGVMVPTPLYPEGSFRA